MACSGETTRTKPARRRRGTRLCRPGKRASTGDGSGLVDRQSPVADHDLEARDVLPPFADRQLDLIVDDALQEPRAVGEAIADLHELLDRGVLDPDPLA